MWLQRKRYGHLKRNSPAIDWQFSGRNGDLKFNPLVISGLENIISLCRAIKAERDRESALDGGPWGNDFQRSLLLPEDFLRYPELVEWATSEKVLSIAASYLKQVPRLASIMLWWAPVNQSMDSSQRFHLDLEDVRQAKFFLYINDVDQDSGPLSFISAAQSTITKRKLNYKEGKVDDDVFFRACDPAELVEFTGKAGSMAMLDTCRCFHYGSRAKNQERLVLMFTFTTGIEVKEPKNDFPPELIARYQKDPLKRLVVRA